MKRLLLATAAVVSFISAAEIALAADMPVRRPLPPQAAVVAPAPIFNWSGFYVGINGGYAWGKSEFDYPGFSTGDFKTDGWLIGGTIGANYQVGQSVFGVEADLDWTDVKGSTPCIAGSCETSLSWLGTVRGRLGYAVDRFMPYVTGGVAFGEVNASIPGASAKDTRVGWTAGLGAEYAFTPNMSWKTEYLYVDLGKFDCGVSCGVPSTEVGFKSHIVRTGLNVRF